MDGGAIDWNRLRRAFSRCRFRPRGDLSGEVAARLISRLDEIAPRPEWIIDVGGDGGAVRERFPAARVLAADIAPHSSPRPRVLQMRADAMRLPLQESSADMVWSNLCLEWTDMRRSFAEAARVLRPHSGLLIFSVLGRDTLREIRAAFDEEGETGGSETAGAPHLMDMHDIGDMLGGCGFSETVMETERVVLTYRTPADAIRDIRESGCGAVHPARRGLFGRRRWRRAMDEYRRQFADADGRIPATYEIIYAVSWRRADAPAERVIQFSRKESAESLAEPGDL